MSILSRPEFHNEEAAYAYVEARVWANGRVCPHCGETERTGKLGGKSTRIGTYKCYACRKPFTVKIGTIFEASHVPMNLWLQAIYLMCASKKGISSNQLHCTLGVTLKTAWFMSHRIREAMRDDGAVAFGSGGGVVEVDETFIGREPGKPVRRAFHHKMKVLTLVDRERGQARSIVVDDLKPATIAPILRENMVREARLMTDEAGHYLHIGREFAEHGIVKHGQDGYARGDAYTNTVEGTSPSSSAA
jgi:transposase-like protein